MPVPRHRLFARVWDKPTDAFDVNSTAGISFDSDLELSYTESVTDLISGTTTQSEKLLRMDSVDLTSVSLGRDFTLPGGSQPGTPDPGWTETISGVGASPTPIFDTNPMRR